MFQRTPFKLDITIQVHFQILQITYIKKYKNEKVYQLFNLNVLNLNEKEQYWGTIPHSDRLSSRVRN